MGSLLRNVRGFRHVDGKACLIGIVATFGPHLLRKAGEFGFNSKVGRAGGRFPSPVEFSD
jgi:hypothetical protein